MRVVPQVVAEYRAIRLLPAEVLTVWLPKVLSPMGVADSFPDLGRAPSGVVRGLASVTGILAHRCRAT